jgi:hypothetical protein
MRRSRALPSHRHAARKIKATSLLLDDEGIVYDGKSMRASRCRTQTNTIVRFRCARSTCWSWPRLHSQTASRRGKELLGDLLTNVKDGIEFNDHIEGVAGMLSSITPADLPFVLRRYPHAQVKIKNPDSR